MAILIVLVIGVCWVLVTFVGDYFKHKLAEGRQKRHLAASRRHDLVNWDTVITGNEPAVKPAAKPTTIIKRGGGIIFKS